MDDLQHIQFPQDVNTECFDEIQEILVQALTCDGPDSFSTKQANWVAGASRSCAYDPQGIAYAIALAKRGGPELEPFAASDDEIESEARRIFDEATAGILRVFGRLQ